MNKEFVPYEPALDLKQLQFDEPCFMLYNSNAHWTEYGCTNTNIDLLNGKDSLVCTAPTYSQAFRWFRDNYNLLCYIRKIGSSYWYNIDAEDGSTLDNEFEGRFDTYEEAELACLKKLIKMVKGGNK